MPEPELYALATTIINLLQRNIERDVRAVVHAALTAAPPPPRFTPQPGNALPEFVSVSMAATHLKCSKGVLYRLVKTGNLPAVRIGRAVRIPSEALRAGAVPSANGQ